MHFAVQPSNAQTYSAKVRGLCSLRWQQHSLHRSRRLALSLALKDNWSTLKNNWNGAYIKQNAPCIIIFWLTNEQALWIEWLSWSKCYRSQTRHGVYCNMFMLTWKMLKLLLIIWSLVSEITVQILNKKCNECEGIAHFLVWYFSKHFSVLIKLILWNSCEQKKHKSKIYAF